MLGILGGMSWESTATYYREINHAYARARGGLHSAPMLVNSLDFASVEELQRRDDWDAAGTLLADAGRALRAAGADILLLATNTMHLVFDRLTGEVGGEWIHIADPTAEACLDAGYRRVGLLGTRFTMERDFYRGRLTENFGLEVLVPGTEDRRDVDRIIFDELVRGELKDSSRARYAQVIEDLAARGAEAVILGCTEIGLLVAADDSNLPVLDTTLLHASAAVTRQVSREEREAQHV